MSFLSMFFKSKTCAVCGQEVEFSIVFCYDIDRRLIEHRRKRFCIGHGLEELGRVLGGYAGRVVIAEPVVSQRSGLFFYQPDDLVVHDYSQEDKENVEKLISDMVEDPHGPVLKWIDQDVVGDCQEKPLFKGDLQKANIMDISQMVIRLEHILKDAAAKFSKGEFWITEPRGRAGIYVMDDVV